MATHLAKAELLRIIIFAMVMKQVIYHQLSMHKGLRERVVALPVHQYCSSYWEAAYDEGRAHCCYPFVYK
jgi:hypothetical protein